MSVKVLVVDDSFFFKKRLSEAIDGKNGISIVGFASNGREAIDLTKQLKPDVITMDIEMPGMNGLDALRTIMDKYPTPVLMFSSLTVSGAEITMKALECGALDFLPKNFRDLAEKNSSVVDNICKKILALSKAQHLAELRSVKESGNKDSDENGTVIASGRKYPRSSLRETSSNTSSGSSSVFRTSVDWDGTNSLSQKISSNVTEIDRINRNNAEKLKMIQERMRYGSGTEKSIAKKETDVVAGAQGDTTSSVHKVPDTSKISWMSRSQGRAEDDEHYAMFRKRIAESKASSVFTPRQVVRKKKEYDIVAIGSSTGGPSALYRLLSQIPADFPLPILIIQHMPKNFTNSFAERLNMNCSMNVCEARNGQVIEPGGIYITPGGQQLMVDRQNGRMVMKIRESMENIHYRPCIDITFASLAKCCKNRVLAVVMTGMGCDGTKGAKILKSEGSTVWAQSEESCVIYGMPKSVTESGLADRTVDLAELATELVREISD